LGGARTGNSGRGVAESLFHGTRAQHGKVEAIGAEVMEIVGGKIKEIRDYHQPVPAKPEHQMALEPRPAHDPIKA